MHKVKTPSSMKWLINKKARISGQINLLERMLATWTTNSKRSLEEAELRVVLLREAHSKNLSLADKLPKLKHQLEAIETALSIHEIQINSSLIAPIRPHKKKAFGPHGSITRGIYKCLKMTNRPTSTKEITSFILAMNGLDENETDFTAMTVAVRKRLGFLAKKGEIERLHFLVTAEEGIWKIPS